MAVVLVWVQGNVMQDILSTPLTYRRKVSAPLKAPSSQVKEKGVIGALGEHRINDC